MRKVQMNSNDESGPGIGLSFTRRMPLSWKCFAATAGGREERVERMRNERLLQLLLFFDEYHNDRRDEEGDHKSDLERVEAKLDAVIHLLRFLIEQNEGGADESLVTVAAHHLEWTEEKRNTPARRDRVWVLLEIDPRLPQALKLAAEVVQLTPIGADQVKVRVKLSDQGGRAQEALEKLIFRIHRREIARIRSGG